MLLYVKPNTKAHLAAVEVLRSYGIDTVLQEDQRGKFLDVTPPAHWQDSRRARFEEAIERIDWA